MHESTNLFQEKVAQTPEFQYNGISGGQAWKVKTLNYLVGRCADAQALLSWAEAQGKRVIMPEELHWLPVHTQNDIPVVAAHIWTYLSLCLKGKAEIVFNSGGSSQKRNGLEAWRRVIEFLNDGSQIHYLTLKDAISNPPRGVKPAELHMNLVEWETKVSEYEMLNGPPMADYERKMIVLKMLPREQQALMLHRAMRADLSYAAFRDEVTTSVAEQNYLNGRHGLNLLDDEEMDEE